MLMNASLSQRLLSAAAAALLTACGAAPERGAPRAAGPHEADGSAALLPAATPQALPPLRLPSAARIPEFFKPQQRDLARAARLLGQGRLPDAAGLLALPAAAGMPEPLRAQRQLLLAELLYRQGKVARAFEILEQGAARRAAAGAAAARYWEDAHIRFAAAVRGPLHAARLAARYLSAGRDGGRAARLQQTAWEYLNLAATEGLQGELRGGDAEWRGWAELALLAARVFDSPRRQAAQFAAWRTAHPLHPAALRPPRDLAGLEAASRRMPERIALLLPLSRGPKEDGRQVLEGFLAAGYQARAAGWPRQAVQVIDTGAHNGFESAYRAAVDAGAELVIGPLRPEWTRRLSRSGARPVPVLALGPLPQRRARQLWQFTLSAEDEAAQAARLAFAAGARDALLMQPGRGWRNDADRILLDEWQRLGGRIRGAARPDERRDYSAGLREALGLGASEERTARINQLMGFAAGEAKVNAAPRPRQDFNAVFLLAPTPQAARSLKPLLAFHYAGDLPVYSTSRIFDGKPDPRRDGDLDGVILPAMPWFFQEPSAPAEPFASAALAPPALSELAAALDSNPAAGRMQALGADAFLLSSRLRLLAAYPEARLRGRTGLLRMDGSGRIQRRLTPAIVRGGVPRPLR